MIMWHHGQVPSHDHTADSNCCYHDLHKSLPQNTCFCRDIFYVLLLLQLTANTIEQEIN